MVLFMLFYSTGGQSDPVTFREAVRGGLAPDGGLWMPAYFPQLPESFFHRLPGLSLQETGFEVLRLFVDGEVADQELHSIVANAFSFDAPTVQLSKNTSVLELFHGPTLAFKDFGARFLASVSSLFLGDGSAPAVVLVATSGDTGSAVAHAFFGQKGIRVVLLYPSGQVSSIQEKQMTTLGENIQALEVHGTFDDCQRLVKQAFQDPEIAARVRLISANSINVARLLPQMIYYFHSFASLPESSDVVFSVPSGNFGNLTAGLFAKRMGLPLIKFIAATNVNDVVPAFLQSGVFTPHPSKRTLSNAMDVGNPSNFARMLDMYGSDARKMGRDIAAYSFSDEETLSAIREVHDACGYVCDPHTAVAYLGLKQFPKSERMHGVILSTAHPAKFASIVKEAVQVDVEMPEQIRAFMNRPASSIPMENDYKNLFAILTAS